MNIRRIYTWIFMRKYIYTHTLCIHLMSIRRMHVWMFVNIYIYIYIYVESMHTFNENIQSLCMHVAYVCKQKHTYAQIHIRAQRTSHAQIHTSTQTTWAESWHIHNKYTPKKPKKTHNLPSPGSSVDPSLSSHLCYPVHVSKLPWSLPLPVPDFRYAFVQDPFCFE